MRSRCSFPGLSLPPSVTVSRLRPSAGHSLQAGCTTRCSWRRTSPRLLLQATVPPAVQLHNSGVFTEDLCTELANLSVPFTFLGLC